MAKKQKRVTPKKKSNISKLKSMFDKAKKNVSDKKVALDKASEAVARAHAEYMNALVAVVHSEEVLNSELNKV